MNRRTFLTGALLGVVLAAANSVDARDLFVRQTDAIQSVEVLPLPSGSAQQSWMPSQKQAYQSVQKMPYQSVQKGSYSKALVATRVRYVQHRPHRKTCCDRSSSYRTALSVIDPKTGCLISVPVCLPTCCTGYPQASGRAGLVGRVITNFCWECGYRVRIVVGHHGTVTVHYYGV
jgi:hypothetical protein